jgi:hypothetical protein
MASSALAADDSRGYTTRQVPSGGEAPVVIVREACKIGKSPGIVRRPCMIPAGTGHAYTMLPSARRRLCFLLPGVMVALLGACSGNRGEVVRTMQERDALQAERDRLLREVEGQRLVVQRLTAQNETLARFGKSRPVDLFAPLKIEILSRSGGADYDGKPGEDGVTVYVRPVDADGDAVKAPGELRIELTDGSTPGRQTPIGLYEFRDSAELRPMWYSRFGTQHYTARCPFPPGRRPSEGARIVISVHFVDYLSGATLTAVAETTVMPAAGAPVPQ